MSTRHSKEFIPIPPIDSFNKYLVFQPHSDDAAIFAGGLLLKLAKMGKKITLVTMTDGRLGTTDPNMDLEKLVEIRRKEDEEAGRILGVKKHIYLPFRDGELPRSGLTTKEMVRIIREEKPDVVLAPDPWLPYEAHPDHINCGLGAAESMIYCGLPLYLPEFPPHNVHIIAFYITNRPNQFVDVEEVYEEKFRAIKVFESQLSKENCMLISQYLPSKTMEFGEAHGMKMAEAFKVLTPFHLHTFFDAEEI
jgi:LmbE family N-acetylglucosaminyl deacetylase